MTTQSTTDNKDDQELANALAGITNDSPKPAADVLNFEETPAPSGALPSSPFGDDVAVPAGPAPVPAPAEPTPVAPPAPLPAPTTPVDTSSFDSIKKDALNELRPLVDKLTVPAEEKFDTYLLLLRSTDDSTLIGPAHDAAKAIPDEARRAQALLDVIKEIDYLSQQK